MTFYDPTRNPLLINRRRLMGFLAGAVAAGIVTKSEALAYLQDASEKTGVTAEEWNPETINALAGTREVDTGAELHALVPETTEGTIQYWNVGPTEASPQITKDLYDEFLETFALYYPNITLDNQNVGYNDMLDKIRTAAAGGAAPDVAKMPILWGVEFAARGDLSEVTLEEFGWTAEQFWPGALKSVTWEDKIYGVPTNNETMAFIWNKQIFADAGLDPENPPATWDDVVAYSNQIKQETGKNGYGIVAKVNAGNTPFRFMPVLWAYGASALDEGEDSPTYDTTMINTPEGIAALQVYYDMYVRDRSVPTSALTNTQTENQDLFIAGEIAMMISHPKRVRRHAGPRQGGHRRRQGAGRPDRRQHGVRLDPGGSGEASGRLRRFQRAHHVRRGPWLAGQPRCGPRAGGDADRSGVVAEEQLGRLQPGKPGRVRDGVDEAAPGGDRLPRGHDRHAAVRHSVPGGAGVTRSHEHHRPGDAAERVDRDDDRRRSGQ